MSDMKTEDTCADAREPVPSGGSTVDWLACEMCGGEWMAIECAPPWACGPCRWPLHAIAPRPPRQSTTPEASDEP